MNDSRSEWIATNGVRPDLPEDAQIDLRFGGGVECLYTWSSLGWDWDEEGELSITHYRLAGNQNAGPEHSESPVSAAIQAPVPAPVWHPCSDRPRVAGVYQRRPVESRPRFQHWNGAWWGLFVPYAVIAGNKYNSGQKADWQDGEWLDPQVNAAQGGVGYCIQHDQIGKCPLCALRESAAVPARECLSVSEESTAQSDSHPIRDKFGLKWPATPTPRKELPAPPVTALKEWK